MPAGIWSQPSHVLNEVRRLSETQGVLDLAPTDQQRSELVCAGPRLSKPGLDPRCFSAAKFRSFSARITE